MKIGIVTLWTSDTNYGQQLQCYALQTYLRAAGHDAYLIRYSLQQDIKRTPLLKRMLKIFNPILLSNFILYKIRIARIWREQALHPRYFSDFRNKFIKQSQKEYYSYDELQKNPPDAEVYITGSDQIWNLFLLINKSLTTMKVHLLDFGDSSVRRIAYAASFGEKQLDNDSIEIFAPLLKKFDYISVREKSGVAICKQCGVDTAEWVLDPTMLLDIQQYRALYQAEILKKHTKPYCFLYLFAHLSIFQVQLICNWAKQRKLDIVSAIGGYLFDKYSKFNREYPTIPEWISLIDNAEYVITDSFHGSVFSLLFSKKFAVIPKVGQYSGMNERLLSLFEMFHIEPRYLTNNMDVLDRDINWDDISNRLNVLRSSNNLLKIIASMAS